MDALIGEVIKGLGAVLVSVLVGLAVQLFKKYKIEVSAAKQEWAQNMAMQAVLVVEEKASAAVKARLRKLAPKEKFNAAVAHVLEKVPGISPEEAGDLVNAQLPKVRAATVDFSTAVLRQATDKDGQ